MENVTADTLGISVHFLNSAPGSLEQMRLWASPCTARNNNQRENRSAQSCKPTSPPAQPELEPVHTDADAALRGHAESSAVNYCKLQP